MKATANFSIFNGIATSHTRVEGGQTIGTAVADFIFQDKVGDRAREDGGHGTRLCMLCDYVDRSTCGEEKPCWLGRPTQRYWEHCVSGVQSATQQ